MRLHIFQKKQMSCEQADILLYYLENIEGVESAKVYERTADAVQPYGGQAGIQQWDTAEEPFAEPSDGGRGAVQAGPWDREG